ncbi:prolyl oligopeptidase family serine peptidase [Inhella gelatinilytica]|uniref:prolyl oligopeptidase n=1 Tax=Inhella gelatinilytica TaxID=2795030 RepID=A0A931NE20_9BURK|nr:prolyl oligopeptidase family serine peptidase [Inhella gelatinilytica]MBH9553219.1 S9 family peptidase [Inhella gelatinilytica]
MRKAVWGAVLWGVAGFQGVQATPSPPDTPQNPVQDRYHGVTVTDPYRWMEDMQSPAFQQWLRSQADFTADQLKALPGRDALRARLGQLADAGVTTSHYRRAGTGLVYLKREPGQNQRRLWWREGVSGPERQLLDPLAVPGWPGQHAIDWFSPSPDGATVALGLSSGGSENSTLVLLDVARGALAPLRLTHTGLNEDGIAWLPNGKGFFFNQHPADERYNKSAVYFQSVEGGAPRRVFGWGMPGRRFAVSDLPYVKVSKGSPWAVAEVLHGDARDKSYFVAPLTDVLRRGDRAPWRTVVTPKDRVGAATLEGHRLLLLSQKTHPHRSVVARPISGGRDQVILAPSDQILMEMARGEGELLVRSLDAGVSRLTRVLLQAGGTQQLPLPFDGTVRETLPLPGGEWLVRLEGWTQAPQTVVVGQDTVTRPVDLQPPSSIATAGFQAERVMVTSHDGVQVPLSLLFPRGAQGALPTILTGYGAYGITQEPRFRPARLGWLERGGRFAICHVRGGGELGEAWHAGAHILNKQNTVSDFIACAQYLIDRGLTRPQWLAGTGGSAGGITIGGAINQAPQLFAAAQAAVGVSDMLRMELTQNGAPNVAEFGTVKNPLHFKAMLALSPYHNVKDGRAYPAVIVTTGANDPRVDAWMPAKFAARLQAATQGRPGAKPVWLRVDYEAGHGMGSSISSQLDEQADVWSFFLWQMGKAHPLVRAEGGQPQ